MPAQRLLQQAWILRLHGSVLQRERGHEPVLLARRHTRRPATWLLRVVVHGQEIVLRNGPLEDPLDSVGERPDHERCCELPRSRTKRGGEAEAESSTQKRRIFALTGNLSLHYARWQWFGGRVSGAPQGPLLELAYWIGPEPGVETHDAAFDIYRDMRANRGWDRWVGKSTPSNRRLQIKRARLLIRYRNSLPFTRQRRTAMASQHRRPDLHGVEVVTMFHAQDWAPGEGHAHSPWTPTTRRGI